MVASAGRGAGELLADNPVARAVSGRGRAMSFFHSSMQAVLKPSWAARMAAM